MTPVTFQKTLLYLEQLWVDQQDESRLSCKIISQPSLLVFNCYLNCCQCTLKWEQLVVRDDSIHLKSTSLFSNIIPSEIFHFHSFSFIFLHFFSINSLNQESTAVNIRQASTQISPTLLSYSASSKQDKILNLEQLCLQVTQQDVPATVWETLFNAVKPLLLSHCTWKQG